MGKKDKKPAADHDDNDQHPQPPDFNLACGAGLVAVSHDSTLHLFEAASNTLRFTTKCGQSIRAVAVTECGKFVAAAGDGKTVECFDSHSGERLARLDPPNGKKLTCLTTVGETALYGDKTGDIFACTLPQCDGRRFVLGHVSMLTAVRVAPSGQFVVTSDGDEKLRVTKWPEALEIECFLLGHTQYVTGFAIAQVSGQEVVVSAGGDGSVRVWPLPQGTEAAVFEFAPLDPAASPVRPTVTTLSIISASSEGILVVALVEGDKKLHLLRIPPTLDAISAVGTIPTQGCPLQLASSGNTVWVITDQAPYLFSYNTTGEHHEVVALGDLPAKVALQPPAPGYTPAAVREMQGKRQKREEAMRNFTTFGSFHAPKAEAATPAASAQA
eukprot:TRINITY_DN10172_c0_g1_i1.p1 TRINITY_DN10172_c0_g1~~TRINITY_DN10172_c0_g1_i1.p1  ORF type:complete len:393 (+),score=79.14 TRINITY_DN10172_c0_g1_i1:25-1179(+)